MNSQDEQDLTEKFLQDMATKYHFSGDTLLSFLARFSPYNAEKSNTNVALEIEWNRKINPNGLETKLQRELTNICNVLQNNGCKLPQRGKGIRDIWKNAYHWLWNEKYPEWKKTQLVNTFSTQENIKIEKEIIIKPETCQIMTEHIIKHLTTNPLTDRGGINFNLDDIYVPLGLYERVKKPSVNKNIEGAELYQLDQYEVTRKFENNDEFFREVLANKNSKKSQGSKIAIIGEAGAGKSTQLQKIAKWIFKQNNQDFVIWVSLADLKDKSLKEYLLQDWLENAFKVARVTEEMETALTNLFKSGKVWLLLDGLDEMGLNNPLATIADYLKPTWLNQARIILTCRLNVWESGNNYLSDFDVYKNLDFSEDQVKEFINKFFAKNQDLGINLITELNQNGKERIRNLIKNPLRLTLLCQFWERRQDQGGGLPDTKAGLYENFVNSIYDWKNKEIPTTSSQRKELNEALGKLALEALDQDSSYFRLTHDQVVKVFGEIDQNLGKLALDLGWLNEVGVAQENPDQVVYAFLHSSFQEYFAALAVGEDYKFFLNHIPENPLDEKASYRVFEKQWKEVMLFWIGENKNDLMKNKFIKELIYLNNQDDCSSIYDFKSYFIASYLIKDYHKCNYEDIIINKLIYWYCGDYEIIYFQNNKTIKCINIKFDTLSINVFQHLKDSLKNINTNKVIKLLRNKLLDLKKIKTIDFPKDNINQFLMMKLGLKEISLSIINCLLYLEVDKKKLNIISLMEEEIFELNQEINNLNYYNHLQPSINIFYLCNCCKLLTIKPNNQEAKNAIKIIKTKVFPMDYVDLDDQDIIRLYADIANIKFYLLIPNLYQYFIHQIMYFNSYQTEVSDYRILETLINKHLQQVISTAKDDKIIINGVNSKMPIHEILRLDNIDKIAICYTVFLLRRDDIKYQISEDLELIDTLVYLMFKYNDNDIRLQIIYSLQVLMNNGNIKTIIAMIKYNIEKYSQSYDDILILYFQEILFNATEKLSYPEFYEAWQSNNNNIHPELKEITPVGKDEITNKLNQQITDIYSNLKTNLKANDKTYPIVIDLSTLAQTTDIQTISNEFCFQIYQIALPNTEITEVNNSNQLKRLIKNVVEKTLNVEQIVLVFTNGDPYPELEIFCQQMINSVYIGWVTNQILIPNLLNSDRCRSFTPDQTNLTDIIQNWIDGIK